MMSELRAIRVLNLIGKRRGHSDREAFMLTRWSTISPYCRPAECACKACKYTNSLPCWTWNQCSCGGASHRIIPTYQ